MYPVHPFTPSFSKIYCNIIFMPTPRSSSGLYRLGFPTINFNIPGPFEKFVDPPYYSESELCGGAVMVFLFEVPPMASDAYLTTLHPLLENVLQDVYHFEISCLGAPFQWLEKSGNFMGRDLDCTADVLMGFHLSNFSKPNTEFNPDLAPCNFWAFPTMKRELPCKRFQRSDQRSAARFREVDGAL
jgi:hypothetical protein